MNLADSAQRVYPIDDMTDTHILQNRVRELRKRLGLRQADLAETVGVTRQTIIAIEKGRLNPSITLSLRLSRALQEPVDYVFYLVKAFGPALDKKQKSKGGSTDSPQDDPGSIIEFF